MMREEYTGGPEKEGYMGDPERGECMKDPEIMERDEYMAEVQRLEDYTQETGRRRDVDGLSGHGRLPRKALIEGVRTDNSGGGSLGNL